MDGIVGFDDYAEDFESFSLPEYRNLAEHCLLEELEVYETDQNLTVSMPEYMCWSGAGYNFLFEYYHSDEVRDGGVQLLYTGYF